MTALELDGIAPAPQFIIDLCRSARRKPKAVSADPVVPLDQPEAIERAVAWLKDAAPEAIEGAGGDHTTFTVAAQMRDFGLSPETAFEIVSEHWNEAGKASPP